MLESDVPVRIGEKTLRLLEMAAVDRRDTATRRHLYQAACDKYAAKAVRVKLAELYERGYIVSAGTAGTLDQSWLTDKGRHTLESHVLIE